MYQWSSSCTQLSSFFNDTATPEIYPLSLPNALPISAAGTFPPGGLSPSHIFVSSGPAGIGVRRGSAAGGRSEEHTSELQSQSNLVCRLLPEKKNNSTVRTHTPPMHTVCRCLPRMDAR